MTTKTMIPPEKLRQIGIEVLVKALGSVGMVRFLQQFEAGKGNYTQDRKRWLKGIDVKRISQEAKRSNG
ncbi:MAG: hypothetical protein V1701_06110 [Planctomycetota bacterium]